MYNFYFGDRETILNDEIRYLTAVKRNLPRWLNSLPDSEFVALIKLVEERGQKNKPVFVDTGIGASTIALVYLAMKYDGRVVSWDMNSEKASALHQVCSETICQVHGKALTSHWTFVHSSSLDPYTGVGVLGDLVDHVDLSIHDSDHTWKTISGEIAGVLTYINDGGVVCVDDANQVYEHTYEPIVTMQRRKIGLGPIDPIPGNRAEPHYIRIPKMLGESFGDVKDLSGVFDELFDEDLYYRWYNTDRANMNDMGMERFEDLKRRFVAYQVSNRIA